MYIWGKYNMFKLNTLISDTISLTCGCLLNTRVLKQVGNLRYV